MYEAIVKYICSYVATVWVCMYLCVIYIQLCMGQISTQFGLYTFFIIYELHVF